MTGMPAHTKYERGYFLPPEPCYDWVRRDHIERAPIWCSVDLRDGNQALVIPMSLEEKLEFFKLLVEIGFKQIEIGFPAASETEYELCRTLIENDMIPADVTIQVLTQAREHIIRRTFEAIEGCAAPVIVHVYNSTSVAQREQVFKKGRDEIKQIAVDGAKLLKQLADEAGHGNFRFEYSPESFTGTEPEYALEVCNAVLDVWQPTTERKAVVNLPATVEMSSPHVYAQQVEYLHRHLKYRDAIELSLHPHNDRGTGIACAELGVLAGADRVEGTLFGNGERTGNVDVVTMAMNMFAQGVDPELDFHDLPRIAELYERMTRMEVEPRRPYAGALVFAAFSGSHQDAIAKGLAWREMEDPDRWACPYLPIDPEDVSRHYESDVIRINSQSGKGGIGYILEKNFGYMLPPRLREELSYRSKGVSDAGHRELSPEEVNGIFHDEYVNRRSPIELVDFHFARDAENREFTSSVLVKIDGTDLSVSGRGNGRLNAVVDALRKVGVDVHVEAYSEHALTEGSTSRAAAYVGISGAGGGIVWGVGEHHDIVTASIRGLLSAINRSKED
ncbi:MAG: 2-isopropylmalate synthase [Eggerthellaceae bacterium]|nr:2-isopropylmalate synthase [Eggerthellaceae bacterium]